MSAWIGTEGEGPRARCARLAVALEPALRRLVPVREPIFVIGCPRSGTTIFTDVFATHPAVANLSEAAWIWDAAFRDPRGDHLRTEHDAAGPAGRRASGVVRLYMASRRDKRFLNKHPRNTLRIRFLNALFPDCRFIHLIRDGRAVVNSLLKARGAKDSRQATPYGNFCKPIAWRDYLDRSPVEQAVRQWVDLVSYARRELSELGPDRTLEVRYEDFCQDPVAVLRQCDRFCRLHPEGSHTVPPYRELASRNHKWLTFFTAAHLLTITRIGGDLLQELGYDAAPAGTGAGVRELVEAGAS